MQEDDADLYSDADEDAMEEDAPSPVGLGVDASAAIPPAHQELQGVTNPGGVAVDAGASMTLGQPQPQPGSSIAQRTKRRR